jgi:hypothetical protein
MQKRNLFIVLALSLASSFPLKAQNEILDSTDRKCFIGSTLMMLGNFIPDDPNPPEYVQLNVGYWITPKDVISFRFKRSIYNFPLGLPWGKLLEEPRGQYNTPGHARILGPTLGYQHFWWKGAYTSVYAMNAFEKYFDLNKKKIGNGYTLYLDTYLGYHIKLFKNRFFIEPAIGISYWPIRNNVPESFIAVEKKWNNYFIQPGLDIGFKF